MWIEIDEWLINLDNVEWITPHDYYPKTRIYVMFKGRDEATAYHMSYRQVQRKINAVKK